MTWTVEALKEHIEKLIDEQDRRIDQAYQSSQDARKQVEKALEKRLDVLNHYKSLALEDKARYATQEVVNTLITRIQDLERLRDRFYGGIIIMSLLISGSFALIQVLYK